MASCGTSTYVYTLYSICREYGNDVDMRAPLRVVLWACFVCIRAAASDNVERMRVEIDAQSISLDEKAGVMEEKEAAALAGLQRNLLDTLKDIMAVLKHGSDASKDQVCARKLVVVSRGI